MKFKLDNENISVNNVKLIKQIIPAKKVDMGGHILDQPLPINNIRQIDPFLLIHHWDSELKGGQKQNNVGVGPHPHRGFSPVTFVFKGSLHHRDSLGNDAVVEAGGTQWMHAGSGITHSERPGKDLVENGGENEFIQFWVNTPAEHKMEEPDYLPISDADTPKIEYDNATIGVVAGEFENVVGPAKIYSPLTLLRGEIKANAEITINIPASFNTIIYLLNGELEFGNKTASDKDLIWFESTNHSNLEGVKSLDDSEQINIKAKKESRFIVLAGEPINEPVVSYGPFVMNTEREIFQALNDAQSGKLGLLEESFV